MDTITLETSIPSVLPTEAEAPPTFEGKKKKSVSFEDLAKAVEGPEAPEGPKESDDLNDADLAAMFSATKKKKKKAKPTEASEENPVPAAFKHPLEALEEDPEELTYDEMLTRIYQKMGATYTASELALKRLQRPKMIAIGTKRVGWTNFAKTAKTLNRTPEHLSSFIEAEFGTNISIDGDNTLVIKGRFSAEQIESVLKKYVDQYIKCRTCKSMETTLERDPESRLSFVKCLTCKSQWSVPNITKGFHATMKGERKAARAAE